MTHQELQKILDENALTLLYFSTPRCNVCKVLRPKVELLIQEEPPWYFHYVNTEDSMEIAGQYLVFSAPTLLLMADGREVGRFSRHFGMGELEVPIRRYAELFD